MRRPEATSTPRALIVAPYDGGQALATFSPLMPRHGWNPASVSEAALAYIVGRPEPSRSPRRLALCAERALYAALPASIKKAQAIERLRGVHRSGDTFGSRAAPLFATADEIETVPF